MTYALGKFDYFVAFIFLKNCIYFQLYHTSSCLKNPLYTYTCTCRRSSQNKSKIGSFHVKSTHFLRKLTVTSQKSFKLVNHGDHIISINPSNKISNRGYPGDRVGRAERTKIMQWIPILTYFIP